MNALRLHVFQVLCFISAISSLYYLSLACQAPFLLFIVFALLAVTGIVLLTRKLNASESTGNISAMASALVLYAVVHFTFYNCKHSYVYGGWDAFAMWNYHARFLSDPTYWQQLYHTKTAEHPDYPLTLSATIASIWRALHNTSSAIPFLIGLWITVATPLLLLAFFWKRNALIAIAILVYFCCSDSYNMNGSMQYADILLGLYLLGAVMSIHLYATSKQAIWFGICGCCMASAAWTKNEGIMIVLFFLLFNVHRLLSAKLIAYFVAGAALPLVALLVHKTAYAPPNDMVAMQGKSTLALITDTGRIGTVLTYFRGMYWDTFRPLVYTFELYLLWCIIKRKWPTSTVFLVLTIAISYMGVYIISPHDLDWHLGTSAERLIHHLIPTFLFAIGVHLAPNEDATSNPGSVKLSVSVFPRRRGSQL